MAMEALAEAMNRVREEQAQSTKKAVPEEKEAEQEKGGRERYDALLAEHGIPDSKEFSHKREQLYLMVEHGMSDAWIGKVIKFPSQKIDSLRMAAYLTGEEFLLEKIGEGTPDEEQIRSWMDEYMASFADARNLQPAGTSVEKSLDVMGRHMVRQQEIATDQINRLTEYLQRISEMTQEKSERDLLAMREEHRREREQAQKQIELLSDENFRLNMRLEEAQENAKKQEKEKDLKTTPGAPEILPAGPETDEGLFSRRRRMKEKRRREEFIAAVLGNGSFSPEQLAVIKRVVNKNFSLLQLQKICDPQVKPENMELLEAYYERRMLHG